MRDSGNGSTMASSASATTEDRNEIRRFKRCFHRVMSGIEKGGSLRFLTLTSSLNSPVDIQASWRKLYMRMVRRRMIEGYVKVTERTKSGLLHLHVLFRGTYVAQAWLSQVWERVHRAPVVDIRKAYGRAGVAGYLAKYMSKAGERYSWSWAWVYRGFAGTWYQAKRIVKILRYRAPERAGEFWGALYRLWRGHLKAMTPPDLFLGLLTRSLDRVRMVPVWTS